MPGQSGPSEIPSVSEIELEVDQDNPNVDDDDDVDDGVEVVQNALENIILLAQNIIDALHDLNRELNAQRGGFHARPQHPHELREPEPYGIRFLRPSGQIEGAVAEGNFGQRPRLCENLLRPARFVGRPIQVQGVLRQQGHQERLDIIGAEAHPPIAIGAEAFRPLVIEAETARKVAVEAEVNRPDGIDATVDRTVGIDAEGDLPVGIVAEGDLPEATDAKGGRPFITDAEGSRSVIIDAEGSRPVIIDAEGSRPVIIDAEGSRPVIIDAEEVVDLS